MINTLTMHQIQRPVPPAHPTTGAARTSIHRRRPRTQPPASAPDPTTAAALGPSHRRRPPDPATVATLGPSHRRRTPTSHLRRPQTYPPPWATFAGTLHPPSAHPAPAVRRTASNLRGREPDPAAPTHYFLPCPSWYGDHASPALPPFSVRALLPCSFTHELLSAPVHAATLVLLGFSHLILFCLLLRIILVQMRFLAA
ncbi:hypothetical protein ACQJBY_059179 [Aegilops geniculata]